MLNAIPSKLVISKPDTLAPTTKSEQQRVLVRGVLFVLLAGKALVTFVFLVLLIMNVAVVAFFTVALIGCILDVFMAYLTRRAASTNEIRLAAFMLPTSLFLLVLAVGLIYKPGGSISAAFIMSAAFAALVGLPFKHLIKLVALNIAGLLFTLLSHYIFKLYDTDPILSRFVEVEILLWATIFVVTIGILLIFTLRLTESKQETERHAAELSRVLATLNSSIQFSAHVSSDVSRVMTTLEETSRSQSHQVREQSIAFTQVATSLSELSNTATQIAILAQAATDYSSEMVSVAGQVMSTNEYSEDIAKQGSRAVAETSQSVQVVRGEIEVLEETLYNLTEQMQRVSSVIELINSIANETHLLALNAAIEAAGSDNGFIDGSGRVQGKRFGVIAQEVRNLARRSREATEEVRRFLMSMQASVSAAALVAEESKKSVIATSERSDIAGSVIEQLIRLVKQNTQSASQIVDSIQHIKIRCEEISIATLQQRTASHQISESVQHVSENSHLFAAQVNHLAVAVSQVSGRVEELTGTLTVSAQ